MRCEDSGKHKAFLRLDLAAFFFFLSFLKSALFGVDRVNEWPCWSGGYMILCKMQIAGEVIPHMPWLWPSPVLSTERDHSIQLSRSQRKTICWTAPKHRAWPTDELTTSRGQTNDFVFSSQEKRNNSGIQMNPLWKLKSKMVIQWVTTSRDWQNHEIQGEQSWDPNMQPEMDLSQLVL